MHATLIFPGITSCGWDSLGKVNNCDANFIPHSLAYIAAYAKADGHTIDAIDLRRLSGWEHFEEEVKKKGTGVFGISSMSVDFENAFEAIKRIKKIDGNSIIILGGVHATVAFDDVKDIEEIDYIIKAEGEISFSNLLKSLEKNEPVERIINGIAPDINTLPYPDRDLFGFREGELTNPFLPHMPAPFVSILASRGCPYKCTFCQPAERAVFGGKARIRTVASVIDELKFLRETYQFKSLLIHDDLFAYDSKWINEFCDAYVSNGFDQIFTCQVRSDFVVKNKELIGKMKECGLSCFMIGFESGSQRVLDFLKKGTTVEMNRQTVEICHEYGIKIFANYMFGIPTETPEEVFTTIDFIRWAQPDHPSPAFFTPHPGSDLYDYCVEHDLSLVKSYKSFARNPTEAKIKGVNYDFLNFAVNRSKEHTIDQQVTMLESLPAKSADVENYINNLKVMKDQLRKLDIYYRNTLVNN